MKIEHQVQEAKRPVWQVLLLVVFLVVAVNAVVIWTNRLSSGYGGLAGLMVIFLLSFYSSRLMSRKLATYTYRWNGEELAVERKLGRRSKPLLEIPGDQIDWVRPFDDMKPRLAKMKRSRKTMVYACRLKGKDVYMLQFHEGKRIYRLVFQPGETLVKALVKRAKEQGR